MANAILISKKDRKAKMYTELLSNLVITKVCSAATFYTPNKIKKRNTRNRWGAIIKYEGETRYSSNGKSFLSDLNHIVLLPKGCSYTWECTKAGHFCNIEFECETSHAEPIVFPVKNTDKIFRMFKELERKRMLNNPTAELESIRDVYSILLLLIQSSRESYVPPEKQRKISLIVDYMSEHYSENLTNDALAQLVGISTTYFRRLFTAYMGDSPISYLHRLRIEKAKEMLKSDYGTISYIAQSLGYASIYDFSRDFKRHAGVSPSKYQSMDFDCI